MTIRTLVDAERYLDGFLNLERQASFDYEELGLGRIQALLDEIGHPEAKLPAIHVTGSKGKGSTALAAEALLRAAGLRVGTYTSPHLESWRERFRLDGHPVSEHELVRVLGAMRPALERLRRDPRLRPSFFDVTTALAFAIFRDAGAEAVVIEVGIGGRIDSTNVAHSRVSVLTCVQLEHTDKLGTTLEAIAREKAGIMRPGLPFLHGPLDPEALAPLVARAVADDALLEEVRPLRVDQDESGLEIQLADGRELRAPILGRHQGTNLALAVRAVETFLERPLEPAELAGLERLQLPARIERIGDVVVDSAHSPDSCRELRRTLESLYPGRAWVLVASLSKDKDASGVFAELAVATRACVLTHAEPLRSHAPVDLEPLAWAAGIESVEIVTEPRAALERARQLARPGELVVVAGSMYLAGRVVGELREAAARATG